MVFEVDDESHLMEILERAYLLEFLSSKVGSESEMDARILKSLVKPGECLTAISIVPSDIFFDSNQIFLIVELFEGTDEEESWHYKIRIALSLNRTDFLPDNMFSQVHWKVSLTIHV